LSSKNSKKKDIFMNIGIICEFNPFHKGHKYLIDSVKKNGDAVICAMSGNFVQRGDFAIDDKFSRAKTAIENGADLVIEIPTVCSTLSAQGFARAGVDILEKTGICDSIAFGAECEDINELKRICREIVIRDNEIKSELRKGISYPQARQNVINSPILDSPNNILAIEYLSYTKLNPIPIKRIGKGHDTDDEEYSASEIRKNMSLDKISSMKNCESAILYKLRNMSAEDFKQIDDVSEGLENRIVDAVRSSSSLEEIYDKIKTKRYTHSRIRRIILRAYLSIDSDVSKSPQYLHILGFNQKGRELLAQMKKVANLPIISKYSDIYNQDELIKELYEQECRLTDIHALGYNPPRPCGTEQTSKIIVV
jgi:predicted nucleotidyltransferase